MTGFVRNAFFGLLLAQTSLLVAEATPAGNAISVQQVVAALAVTHVPLQPSQVQFLAEASSKGPNAALTVESVKPWNDGSTLVRMRCRKPGECLPFFVVVKGTQPQELECAVAGPRRTIAKPRQPREVLVRAGQKATMILESRKFRVATPIICLENGSEGQRIRVSSLDRKRISTAEVLESGLLRGSL